MMRLPNSVESVDCYTWCSRCYFELMGDKEPPNTDGEIHLEPCTILEVYEEYKVDQEANGDPYLRITQFAEMWSKCFA